MKAILQNRLAQLGIALLVGGVIGVTFYPTKTITEKVKKEYQEKLQEEKRRSFVKLGEVNEAWSKDLAEQKERTEEVNRKYILTKVENSSLKSKMKERTLKIVKPDGTIVEETYKESETEQVTKVITSVKEEFNRKVKSIETRYAKIHAQRVKSIKETFDSKETKYKQTIAKLESERKVEINPKKLGLEIGINDDKSYYLHPTYDILGPVFLGGNIERSADGTEHKFGIGIGIRF